MLENKVTDALKQIFKPEFLNRIDEVIVFTELSKPELKKIIDLMLKDVISKIESKDMNITISEDVKDIILEQGYSSQYGARPLRKTIQRLIENPLTDNYLSGKYSKNTSVNIYVKDNQVVVN